MSKRMHVAAKDSEVTKIGNKSRVSILCPSCGFSLMLLLTGKSSAIRCGDCWTIVTVSI